jgi:hypothetical protein
MTDDTTELVLKPGTTPEQHSELVIAIAAWLDLATAYPLIRRLRISICGGPPLTREETLMRWAEILPPGLVDDVLIGGHSWRDTSSSPE